MRRSRIALTPHCFGRDTVISPLIGNRDTRPGQLSSERKLYSTIIFRVLFAHSFHYLRTFPFSFSLPRRNSDPGSLRRLFPPLPTTVRALLSIAGRFQLFLPSPTRVELCLRHAARHSQCTVDSHYFFIIFSTIAPEFLVSPQLSDRFSSGGRFL